MTDAGGSTFFLYYFFLEGIKNKIRGGPNFFLFFFGRPKISGGGPKKCCQGPNILIFFTDSETYDILQLFSKDFFVMN